MDAQKSVASTDSDKIRENASVTPVITKETIDLIKKADGELSRALNALYDAYFLLVDQAESDLVANAMAARMNLEDCLYRSLCEPLGLGW